MDFPDPLKNQVTIPNIVFLLCLVSLALFKYKRSRASLYVIIFTGVLVLLTSTYFFPYYVISRMERQYQPINELPAEFRGNQVLVHVLGGGYTLRSDAPPNVQLGSPTLGRLVEGIRIQKMIQSSILVTSGHSPLNFESQASIGRKAAIMLGVDSARIEMLETPSNTWEEAEALREKFGTNRCVIVVSDAVHLPRATAFFEAQGFRVIGSPSNFLIPPNAASKPLVWLPSMRNIELSNIILREYLGSAKGFLLN